MTTPNNAAAAMERIGAALFGKDLYAVLMDVQNGIDSPGLVSMANSAIRSIDAVRDEFVTLRATLAQPDALTSQPSGEAVAWMRYDGKDVRVAAQLRDNWKADYTIPLYLHPSADAPGVAVAWLITWNDGSTCVSFNKCHPDDGTCVPLNPPSAMLAASPQQEPGAKAKPTYQDLIDYVTDNPSGQTLAAESKLAAQAAEIERLNYRLQTADAFGEQCMADIDGLTRERDAAERAKEEAELGARRYEVVRRLNAQQFSEMLRRNVAGENFDAMVDALLAANGGDQEKKP